MDNAPAVREGGRFVKGVSGNPLGRPKGTKNHIVALQQELEVAVRTHVSVDRIKRIINRVCEQAEHGNLSAAKLIFDHFISKAAPLTSDDAPDAGRTVVFRIENATFAAAQQQTDPAEHSDVIEAEVISSEESNGKA